jgi:hypothetical protein
VRWLLALILVLAPGVAFADVPPARVTCELDNESPWVGQRVRVVVTLMTLTTFDSAPSFDLPRLEGALFLRPEDRPVLGTVEIDDEQYTIARYELSLFAHRAGRLALPPFRVRFASAKAWGEEPVDHALSTPRLELQARMPPGAEALSTLICATSLSASQTLDPKPEQVVVGDALTRRVTLRAVGVPGMALPPTLTRPVEGASAYARPAQVEDERQRGAFLGQRSDQVTYVFEREGPVTLPALVIRWWNLDEKRLETLRLPAVRVWVEAGISAAPAETQPLDLPNPWPWVLMLWGVMFAPLAWLLSRRRRPADSEHARFVALRAALRCDDASAALAALYHWLAAWQPGSEVATLASLEPEVSGELLHELLGAAAQEGAPWTGQRLLTQVEEMRRAGPGQAPASPLASLNPRG